MSNPASSAGQPAWTPTPPPAPASGAAGPERVSRGLAFAALSIPAGAIGAAIVFTLVPGFPLFLTAAGGVAVATLAQWLYARGAGTIARDGLPGLIAISVVAVIVTGAAGIVANVFAAFQAVGGRGGLLGPTFLQVLGDRIDGEPLTFLLVVALLALGGVFSFVGRRAREVRRRAAEDAATPPNPPGPSAG